MNSLFALVDCNNFYVSCERVFDPRLEGRPVAVMSNNDGCIVARSDEVKALGVKMGAPVYQNVALFKRHGVLLFSSNYALYADMSRRVNEILETFGCELEVYSIDEAFMRLEEPMTDCLAMAGSIRAKVRQWTGLPVSVGIGPTKTLAKLANKRAKKCGGVFAFDGVESRDEVLAATPIIDVWGIGPRHAKFLMLHEIRSALDLKNADPHWIKTHLSVTGVRTHKELGGLSCIPMESAPPPKKAIACARMFSRPTQSLEEIEEALAAYTARAAEKLRGQGSAARTVEVYLTTNRFLERRYSNTATARLPEATSDTPTLTAFAHDILARIFRPGWNYNKVGINLMELVPERPAQTDFLSAPSQSESETRLMGAVDRINRDWGRHTIRLAAEGIAQPWKMRRAMLSRRFTTRWGEIPVAML